jgi:hypothetical protein
MYALVPRPSPVSARTTSSPTVKVVSSRITSRNVIRNRVLLPPFGTTIRSSGWTPAACGTTAGATAFGFSGTFDIES